MNTNPNVKRILCFGDSNMQGMPPTGSGKERYPANQRWLGVAQDALGKEYEILEEALWGRTTGSDDIKRGLFSNGLTILPVILHTYQQIDVFVYMLGTNDVHERKKVTPEQSFHNIKISLGLVHDLLPNAKILLIAPVPIDEEKANRVDQNQWQGGGRESHELEQKLFTEYSKEQENIYFLRASDYIQVSEIDGVHFNIDQHRVLGNIVASKIKEIFYEI